MCIYGTRYKHAPNCWSSDKCFSTGDVEIFADNTQWKGKAISVRENGTTPIGIAINVVFIQANPDNMLQLREDLSPEEWAGKNDNNSLIEIIKKKKYENSLNVEISCKYCCDSQQKILLNVDRSLSKGQDAIDISLQRERIITFMFCGSCLEFNEKGNCSCSLHSASFKTFCDRGEWYGNYHHVT